MASMTWEVGQIDLRYENSRFRDERRESALLSSIAERGMEVPLQGVVLPTRVGILLDGFKRFRCAKKLGLEIVPWEVTAESEADGVLSLLLRSNTYALHLLEQARFVDELRNRFHMTVGEIALRLERSTGWVSMRLGMLSEMSSTVQSHIFSGRFPVRSYLYTMRHFTRVKRIAPQQAEEFVVACSGKGLSTRQIEILARGYFEGGDGMRELIRQGHFDLSLKQLSAVTTHEEPRSAQLTEAELGLVRDLDIAHRALGRLLIKSERVELHSAAFFAEGELLCGGILSRFGSYREAIAKIYARCREKKDRLGTVQPGRDQERDCTPA